MDVLLQTHGSKRVFPIPEGLRELTSDIIREVLRHQPECIHAFIAEYLETMVMVREKARDSAVVVSNIFRQGYFFDDLYRTKNVKREQTEAYASVLQAGWRGYVVRKKFRMYLQKKRKMQEDRERKKIIKIEQYLDSIGITYDEATRAACVIQAAYRQSRRGKWVINEAGEEVWMEGENVPFGQRMREADKSQGRYDRWEKADWGDFFEIDEEGEIHHNWPRVGQLFKIPRDLVTPDMEVVRFYGMRDLEGKEQYAYLKGPQKGRNPRGFPIGFLIPLPREMLQETSAEVIFVKNTENERMGNYTYVYEKSIEKQDLIQFAGILEERKATDGNLTQDVKEEFDYDPEWVLPKVLVQIRKDCFRETDDEVEFVKGETAPVIDEYYTFKAEKAEISSKVIDRILKSNCSDLEEAMADAGNIPTYRQATVGRFLPVEKIQIPNYIQKVVIQKETKKAEYENREMDLFEYVFLPRELKWPKKGAIKAENPIKIPLARFQGYRNNYRASAGLDKSLVFVMGPMMYSPDGKPLTHHSIFWDYLGLESWYQLLCNVAAQKIARLGEAAEDVEEQHEAEAEENAKEEEGPVEEEKPSQEMEALVAAPLVANQTGKEEQEKEEQEEEEEEGRAKETEDNAETTEKVEVAAKESSAEQKESKESEKHDEQEIAPEPHPDTAAQEAEASKEHVNYPHDD